MEAEAFEWTFMYQSPWTKDCYIQCLVQSTSLRINLDKPAGGQWALHQALWEVGGTVN